MSKDEITHLDENGDGIRGDIGKANLECIKVDFAEAKTLTEQILNWITFYKGVEGCGLPDFSYTVVESSDRRAAYRLSSRALTKSDVDVFPSAGLFFIPKDVIKSLHPFSGHIHQKFTEWARDSQKLDWAYQDTHDLVEPSDRWESVDDEEIAPTSPAILESAQYWVQELTRENGQWKGVLVLESTKEE